MTSHDSFAAFAALRAAGGGGALRALFLVMNLLHGFVFYKRRRYRKKSIVSPKVQVRFTEDPAAQTHQADDIYDMIDDDTVATDWPYEKLSQNSSHKLAPTSSSSGNEDGYLVPVNYTSKNDRESANNAHNSVRTDRDPVDGNGLDKDGYLKLYHAVPPKEDVAVYDNAAYDDCLVPGTAIAVTLDDVNYANANDERNDTIGPPSLSEYSRLEAADRNGGSDEAEQKVDVYTALQSET